MRLKSLFLTVLFFVSPAFIIATPTVSIDKLVTCEWSTLTWSGYPKTGELGTEAVTLVGKGPIYNYQGIYPLGQGASGKHRFHVTPGVYTAGTKYLFGITYVPNQKIHANSRILVAEEGCKK